MEYGIFTTLQIQIGNQPNGQLLAKAVQSDQKDKSRLSRLSGPYFAMRIGPMFIGYLGNDQ